MFRVSPVRAENLNLDGMVMQAAGDRVGARGRMADTGGRKLRDRSNS
jgi:hypothetical protein